MNKFANLFRIAYHGSGFHGSQIQPDVVTVEGIVKKILNELGDEGWELIKIRGNGITPTYYFKRPL